MAYMTIKVSNTMVKYIKDILPKNYSVKLVKMTDRDFRLNVDYDEYSNEVDYGTDNLYKVIKITYPDDYYANPLYFTTKELISAYRSSVKYNIDFKQELNNLILI